MTLQKVLKLFIFYLWTQFHPNSQSQSVSEARNFGSFASSPCSSLLDFLNSNSQLEDTSLLSSCGTQGLHRAVFWVHPLFRLCQYEQTEEQLSHLHQPPPPNYVSLHLIHYLSVFTAIVRFNRGFRRDASYPCVYMWNCFSVHLMNSRHYKQHFLHGHHLFIHFICREKYTI